jgi:glycosyltransferase involved in cell wall biosynthesis
MHILVTSPIPSHPQDHGNRARVFILCKALQTLGHQIHFVYSGFEGLTTAQEIAMREAWDHTYILPLKSKKRPQSRRSHHLLDDWYDNAITTCTMEIIKKWPIGACFANYVWCSRWLLNVPKDIPTYIDTHDIFAERHKTLRKDGITPQWFSTTKTEEGKGLDRAQTVFAIQELEAAAFETRTSATVEVLGHLVDANFLPPTDVATKRPFKIGFIGSTNMVNVRTFEMLASTLASYPGLIKQHQFYAAGSISNKPFAQASVFNCLGFVNDPKDFYQDMDIILNPNLGGSGLKIKSVEALAFGKPLIATSDAMIGLPTANYFHGFKTIKAFCAGLEELCSNPQAITDLATAGQSIFLTYQKTQKNTLLRHFPRPEKSIESRASNTSNPTVELA